MTRVLVGHVGDTGILVGHHPVAAIQGPGQPTKFVTWPDAALPDLAAIPSIIEAPNALWVIYTGGEGWDGWIKQTSTAVRIDPQSGQVASVELGTSSPVGADADGLWVSNTTSPNAPNPEDAKQLERALAGDDVAQPEWFTLAHIAPDGRRAEIVIDRVVRTLRVVDGHRRVEFYTRGPRVTRWSHGSFEFSYPLAQIDLPSGPVPPTVSVDDYAPRDAGTLDGTKARAPVMSEIDLELPTADEARWTLRPLETDRIAECTRWVADQLRSLAAPSRSRSRSGVESEIPSRYVDLRVRTVGEWPLTEVVAEFRWQRWGGRQVRYRTRVFNDAGRPALERYMTVFLEEELETTPPTAHPFVDGAIEIAF